MHPATGCGDYSHLKNFIASARHPVAQPPIIRSCFHVSPIPAPLIIISLKASPRWVDGSPFETYWRKRGMISIGKKIPPKNIRIKKAIIEIGVALLAVLIKPVREKPILIKHNAPKVNINQNAK